MSNVGQVSDLSDVDGQVGDLSPRRTGILPCPNPCPSSRPPPTRPPPGPVTRPRPASVSAPRVGDADYCGECGYIFATESVPPAADIPTTPVAGRFRLVSLVAERNGVARFRGRGRRHGRRAAPGPRRPPGPPAGPAGRVVRRRAGHGLRIRFADGRGRDGRTPDLAERRPLAGRRVGTGRPDAGRPPVAAPDDRRVHRGRVRVPGRRGPVGTPLWDAWDRPYVTNRERFGWLIQLAEAVHRLHAAGAILEGLRPEMAVISPGGIAILADLGDLLPLPLPRTSRSAAGSRRPRNSCWTRRRPTAGPTCTRSGRWSTPWSWAASCPTWTSP